MKIPKTMCAVTAVQQKLVVGEHPVPKPKADEVLVRVQAAGVNRPDILQRQGLYPPPHGVTSILGLEVAGKIVSLGKNVTGYKLGQAVCALVAGGGYAEYVAVPVLQLLPIPKGVDVVHAAVLPETFFTVWTNLHDRAHLSAGETLLIHGGSSGIGTTAIQMAKHFFKAKVIVTAGTDKKIAVCKKLGARAGINYKTHDFVEEVLSLTKGRGVDVVLDMVGGDYLPRNLKILNTDGRHVSIAMQHGRKADLDILMVMQKRLILTGSTLRPQSPVFKGAIAKALKKNIWGLIEKKKITPFVSAYFPLTEAERAHAFLESGECIGKVVLIMG